MDINPSDLRDHPYDRYHPEGYQKFQCLNKLSLEKALDLLGMTLDAVGKFNFGDDPDYKKCFDECFNLGWRREASGASGRGGRSYAAVVASGTLVGDDRSWFWVPGSCTLPPNTECKLDGTVKKEKEETPSGKQDNAMAAVLAPRPQKFYAARSQSDGVWATATVDCGIEAGDILFSHHAQGRFIARMTMSWMTHAGIAVNAEHAVDADGRTEGQAVAAISVKDFFQQGDKPTYTPTGGLVYRYKGKPGDSPEEVEQVRYNAAVWAQSQINNQWKFSLEHSPIIAVKEKKGEIRKVYHDPESDEKIRIVEKEFDSAGKGVDSSGRQPQFWSRSKGKYIDTPLQTIYCAELVWRAYRAAGVNIVDPKKLFNLYEDDNCAIANILEKKISADREVRGFKQEKGSQYAYSQTAKEIGEGIGGVILRLAKVTPNSVSRKIVLDRMKLKNSGFLCAPYQLAESSLCKRFAQLPPVSDKDKEIEVADFHNANLNPLDVVKVLCQGDDRDSYLKAWQDFENKKAKKVKVSVQKPWPNCCDKEAPKLVATSEDYNKPVDFSAASQKPPFMT